MATTFLQFGYHWVNLDQVASVELIPDAKVQSQISSARIHFTTGKHKDYTDAADVQDLVNWLRSHKAT